MIKRFDLLDVLTNDGILYNTNNHYEVHPADYKETVRQGNTRFWIDSFHQNYKTIVLDTQDLKWMMECFQLCSQTRRFSHIYDDELEATCSKYQFPAGQWFIRTERVSLKGGCYGAGPYDSMEKVIKSMVTCKRGHQCFQPGDTSCVLYILPWLTLDPEKEFRIFVYNNSITAFSAQNIYSVNDWLNSLTDEKIVELMSKIKEFFELEVQPKMRYMGSYTMDLAIVNDELYFIEPNSFGAEYSAGSALYHWLNDEDKLHSSAELEMRYTAF